MIVTITLYCGPNYLVPDCRSYCVSRNDSLGHYRCNYVSGRKLCLEGWYDPLTNCVKKRKYCTPRNDSIGHYSCDANSGEKMCLNGWTGKNCTQICHVSSCQQSTIHASEGSSIAKTAKTTTISTTHTPSSWANVKTSAASSQSSCAILYKLTRSSSLVSPRKISESRSNTPLKAIMYSSSDLHSSQNSKALLSSMLKPPSLSSLYSSALSSLSSLLSSSSLSPSSSSSSSPSSLSSSALTSSLSSLQLLPSPSFLTLPLSSSSSSSTSSQLLSSSSPSTLRSSLLFLNVSPNFQSSELVTVSFGGPSVAPSPTNIYQQDGIEIEISESSNWTMGKMENVRRELVKKVNEFCHDYPLTCLTTPNTFVNRTVFNTSHIMAKITRSSNGKAWLRVKVTFPVIVESLPSGAGYLPSHVLKEIVLKNKAHLEKNLEAEIVAVKEVAWNQPITSVIQLSVTLTTKVTATARVPTTIHRYIKPNFLPYVLVALSVTAVLIIAFALCRRRHLRKLRILPQSISNSTEEELTTFVLKSSKTDNSSHTAVSINS
ncbi:PREDICTED: uncharacterized protein DDB_G0271670-like [Acropora digitifera]|uniref:uncharacterized protein DDB_G0271670-like n=1 Tax=Acropora digitifera TaxID=70779 RepID=UPI00077A3B4E|nr:PREDICTED: uncharacterized protein DDB_G0271670-like [Acropora digitifera]